MGLIELGGASAVSDFISSNTNAVVTFSAHWCGPCKASKPQLEQLAATYAADVTKNVKIGIAYENDLGDAIHMYNVRAFPTYVLFQNGSESNRVQGANIPGVQQMIESADNITNMTGGETLGGSGAAALSPQEARLARLAKLEGAGAAAPAPQPEAAKEEPKNEEPEPMKEDKEDEKDVEMKDAEATPDAEEEKTVDPTVDLNPEYIKTLTEEMGFTLIRAQKGLLNGNGGTVEGAVEWLMQHQEDDDIDSPIEKVAPVAQSYKCNECGKILSNMANLELHANKTGHSDFEESTQHVKPLTEEEKAAKVAEIKELLKAKRAQREEQERQENILREKARRTMGKEMAKTKEQLDAEQRKREAYLRRKEKEEFKRERQRLREQIARDKAERAAQKGKLTSKLSVEGYKPDMLQMETPGGEGAAGGEGGAVASEVPKQKKLKADAGRIDEYIKKVSSYRAGGDGGKCLKILKIYVSNVVDNPDEEKFKTINMENKAFKTKVKPFVGAKNILLAVGFSPNEGGDALVLSDDDVDKELLAETKAKLEAALVAYG